jgi:hypothetical protein
VNGTFKTENKAGKGNIGESTVPPQTTPTPTVWSAPPLKKGGINGQG